MAGPHLERLRAQKSQKRVVETPSKPSKPSSLVAAAQPTADSLRFEGFEGAQSRSFSDFLGRYGRTMAALEARCPDLVPADRWQLAVDDGRRFLARWGDQAEALGWTSRDLFGLHTPPDGPHPSHSRLSRYDETGLIWLLCGRPVVALTAATAAIRSSSGSITIYRRS